MSYSDQRLITCQFCGTPAVYRLSVYWSHSRVRDRKTFKVCRSCYERREIISHFKYYVSMSVKYLDGSKVVEPKSVEEQFEEKFEVLRDPKRTPIIL